MRLAWVIMMSMTAEAVGRSGQIRLRLLLDTNVFIAVEPYSGATEVGLDPVTCSAPPLVGVTPLANISKRAILLRATAR